MTRLLLLALLIVAPLSHARTIANFEFPEVLPRTTDHPELKLNGGAIRTMYYLVDAYVGLMYVENPSDDPDYLISQDTHKRVVYHILVNRVSGRRIATAMYESMRLNLNEQEATALAERLEMLVAMFDRKMERGDVGYVEYIPGKGSKVVIKGEERGIIPGKDLFDALMKIWIGDQPVTQHFKEGILGLDHSDEQVTDVY